MNTSISQNHITAPAPALITPDMAGAVYLGTFKPAAGGRVPVLDKASMEVLFDGASGNAADVAEAAKTGKAAQGAWAPLPPTARGDVLRKFAVLCEQHVEEISRWIVRETGSIPPKGPLEVMTSVREAIEIAALTGQPVGHILWSSLTRASYARPGQGGGDADRHPPSRSLDCTRRVSTGHRPGRSSGRKRNSKDNGKQRYQHGADSSFVHDPRRLPSDRTGIAGLPESQ